VWSFGKRYRPLIGLDITTSSVKLIELTMSGGQYRVESYAAEPTPHNAINEKAIVDAEAVGEAIRRAVKRSGAKSRLAAIAISGDAAITKVIQMPKNLGDNELEGQVEMQADQYIPFPMEEVSYDYQVVGPSDKDPEMLDVLLVATRTENVEQRQAAVQASGLTAHIVDVEAFALENACALMRHQMPDGGMDRTVAVVDFGASSTTFSVLRDMRVIYTRDFAFGGQQLTEERRRPAEQLPARSARSVHRRYDPTGQPFPAVLSGLRQRPLAARPDFDLRRLRQHTRCGGCHIQPRRSACRQG
jgi:type IV pilus assembly protein PilM